MSCSALHTGSARDASGHVALLYMRAPKTATLGSWDMYSLARSGRVRGLQCTPLLILKQVYSESNKVSGIDYGSSYSNCWVCFCFLCSFRSFVKDSL